MSRKRALTLAVLLCLAVGGYPAIHHRSPAVFYKRYKAVKIGMTTTEVENL